MGIPGKKDTSSHHATFLYDKYAVFGLPMRLTVSLLIGTIALIAILSYMLNPCLFPATMIVTVDPLMNTIPIGQESAMVNTTITVRDHDAHPVSDAIVLVNGLGGSGSGYTDRFGEIIISLNVTLEPGITEGYLDVSVKAPCLQPFNEQDMIKVVKERAQ